jgi:electron transfer flavoprotein beta subunit
MVNIVVCVKQVLDPEAPASAYKVDDETKSMIQKGVPPVISPFDENALEAALRIKDTHEANITILSMGRNLSKAVLRKTLAAGGDKLILLEDELFHNLDSYATATILATPIRKIGVYDIILAGIQAADWNAGLVGSGIAEILGIPSVTTAQKVELNGGNVLIERLVSDGYEIIESSSPVLITVSNELGELRSTTIQEVMSAQKKPLTIWNSQDLGIEMIPRGRNKLCSLIIPQKKDMCEMVTGETEDELGINLALRLWDKKII